MSFVVRVIPVASTYSSQRVGKYCQSAELTLVEILGRLTFSSFELEPCCDVWLRPWIFTSSIARATA